QGQFRRGGEAANAAALPPDLRRLLLIAARCNNARLTPAKYASDQWEVIGDPTEGALLALAMKGGIDCSSRGHRQIEELPFDSQRKAMSVVTKAADGTLAMYSKGAPEVILAMCEMEN